MYIVSEDYKTQIRNTLRNPSYIKVDFSVVDPQARGDSDLSSITEQLYYSNLTDDTLASYDVNKTYNTLELNRFLLDGKNPLAPAVDDTFIYQGFVGSEISDSTGIWTAPQKITVDFRTTYFKFIGLTFSFDSIKGDYPKDLRIIAYKDSVEVYNTLVYPNSAVNWCIEDEIPECNKLEIASTQSNTPYRRFRLENLLFGIFKTFENDVIESAKWIRNVDLLNSKLPTHTFDFKIIDVDREYDPENPSGIYKYMEEEQPIKFYFGYELDDESIEWIKCGDVFTTGELQVDSNLAISKGSIFHYISNWIFNK